MKMRFALLLIFLLSGGCSTLRTKIPDFKAHITLPASGDGYWVKTVSDQEGRIPKEHWDILRKRGIVLLSEDWAILRNTVLKNCLSQDCKDTVGVFDELFYNLDAAIKLAPKK